MRMLLPLGILLALTALVLLLLGLREVDDRLLWAAVAASVAAAVLVVVTLRRPPAHRG
ncbi:MAG: hypothetical protein WKF47_01165 [Geodermatophilaceae bacterium]|jgi:ABC-type long-subunit fatty acid transport system fused permease/ATPase subunit|nr:hypothetical protein [Geodermatophilaceae bacterium]